MGRLSVFSGDDFIQGIFNDPGCAPALQAGGEVAREFLRGFEHHGELHDGVLEADNEAREVEEGVETVSGAEGEEAALFKGME